MGAARILAVYAAGKTIVLYLGQGTGSHDDVLNRLTVIENASTPRRWARHRPWGSGRGPGRVAACRV